MVPNMRFYVISIVAIFAALGIGIYIGFTIDAQDFVVEQKEEIAAKIEETFEFLRDENQGLKISLKELEDKNSNYEYFIDSTYQEIVKGKLAGTKVAIIETNADYVYSGIGQILDIAGASVVNVTTITDRIMNKDILKDILEGLDLYVSDNVLITNSVEELTKSIINGEETQLVKKMVEQGIIDVVGLINEPVDYIIIAGGSIKENKDRIGLVDRTIINTARNMEKQIIGIEKSNTEYSYMEAYKKYRISTVDNIDTSIGKVSLILAMEGRPGNYGIKSTAEDLIPKLTPVLENSEESENE
ncbi:MAG: copper transporter [Tissierellia bacterium]|nr:copper transporter [Tissierellia bacterium]